MAEDPLFIVAAIASLAVLAVLATGIAGYARGGEFNRKYANKIMRLRLLAQALAVFFIFLFVLLRGGGD